MVILLSVRYLEIEDEQHGEYYALMLFATIGMMFLACGNDLIVLFIGLETMAISFYVLSGFLRRDRRSNEGALKYVLLGAFSSGILAYGFSLLYGIVRLDESERHRGSHLRRRPPSDLLVIHRDGHRCRGSVLQNRRRAVPSMGAGRLRRRADSDFRVCQRGFQGRQFRAAAAAVPHRILAGPRGLDHADRRRRGAVDDARAIRGASRRTISSACWRIPRSRMWDTSCSDWWQDNDARACRPWRFIFWSTRSFNTGAFAIVIVLRRKGVIGDELDDLNGLIQRNPGAAILMLIFLLSLAGIPPTAGFIGKLLIFWALIQTQHYVLAVLAVLYILPAVYYYFRFVAAMLVRESTDSCIPRVSLGQAVALAAMVIVTLAAGIYPNPFIEFARYSLGALGR